MLGADFRANAVEVFAEREGVKVEGFAALPTFGRPWVRMKIAASLDGKTALDNGASQWITSRAARIVAATTMNAIRAFSTR